MVFTPSPQTQSNLSKAAFGEGGEEGSEPRGRECREEAGGGGHEGPDLRSEISNTHLGRTTAPVTRTCALNIEYVLGWVICPIASPH